MATMGHPGYPQQAIQGMMVPSRPGALPPNGQRRISPAMDRQRREDEAYARKHHLLKRSIKALVFKNAALCDEVARLKQRMATVGEERKILLRRIFHQKRLEQRRRQMAEKRLLQHQAMASINSATTAEGQGLQSPSSSVTSATEAEERTLAAIARDSADTPLPEAFME